MERFNVCTYINIFFFFVQRDFVFSFRRGMLYGLCRPSAVRVRFGACVRASCCARCARARRPAVAPATAAANNPDSGRPSRRRPARSTFHRSRSRHLRPPRRNRRTHARTHLRTHKHTHIRTHALSFACTVGRPPASPSATRPQRSSALFWYYLITPP